MSPKEGFVEGVKDLDEKYVHMVAKFVSDIRNGKLQGSLNIALATISFLEQIISESQNATAFELVGVVRSVGAGLSRALPWQPAPALMVRRVLRAIRDEHRATANQSGEGAGESLQRLVLAAPSRRATLGPAQHDLREPIRDQIAEFRTELESSTSSICSQAREHLHSDELVLTYGAGSLAEKFLKAAPRTYRLILAEGPDVVKSHAMAARLSSAGVAVTVITNAAIFGVMSRVNKVVVCAMSAVGGGGAAGAAGLRSATAAAKHYSVPVLVLAPLHKLSPIHACEPQHLSHSLGSPLRTLSYEHAETGVAHVYAPVYDLIPPDHITLFITNLGGSSPSYIYRLLSELYDPKDIQL